MKRDAAGKQAEFRELSEMEIIKREKENATAVKRKKKELFKIQMQKGS